MDRIPLQWRRWLLAVALGIAGAGFSTLSNRWVDETWSLDGVGQVGSVFVSLVALLLGARFGALAAVLSVLPRLLIAFLASAPSLASAVFGAMLTVLEAAFLGWAVVRIRPVSLRQAPPLVILLFWAVCGMPACIAFRSIHHLDQEISIFAWTGVVSCVVLALLHIQVADLIAAWSFTGAILQWAGVQKERTSLRSDLLRNLLLVSMIPLLMLMLVDGPASARRRQKEAERHLDESADAVARGIDANIDRQRAALEELAAELSALPPSEYAAQAETRVASFHKLFPDFRTITIADTTGAVMLLQSTAGAAADRLALARRIGIGDRDYFDTVRTTHATTLSRVFMGRVTGKPLVSVAAPLMRGSKWTGVVAGSLSLADLDAILRDYPALRDAKIAAADYDQRLVFTNWPGLHPMDSFLETDLFRAWMSNQRSNGRVFHLNAPGAEAVTVAHHVCGNAGWRVFVGIPDASIHAQTTRNYMLSVFWLAVAGSLSLALSRWVGARLSQPLELLVERLRDFAVGSQNRYAIDAGQHRSQEILALEDSFADMSARVELSVREQDRLNAELKALAAQLETKVLERTAELQASTERANVASLAKSEFLANMSHELRTPLNGIIGLISLAMESMPPSEERDQVSVARQSAQALTSLLAAILDFTDINTGQVRLDPKPFSLIQCVNASVESITGFANIKGLRLEIKIDPSLPDRLVGDFKRICQVLTNLLNNAVKFSDRGTVRIAVSKLDSNPGHTRLRFQVADEGIGIAPEKLATICDPFEMGDAHSTRRFGGAGLGLAITQKLLELMGSAIQVESTENAGSTFTFDLALKLVAGESSPDDRSQRPEAPASPAVDSLSILIAEDNQVNQTVARRILERAGHKVALANNGKEAVEQINKSAFDIVLMDIQMPELDGLEATREIRRMEAGLGRHMPIIAVTANAMKGDDELCLNAGMDAYLTKPIKKETLLAAVEKFANARAAA